MKTIKPILLVAGFFSASYCLAQASVAVRNNVYIPSKEVKANTFEPVAVNQRINSTGAKSARLKAETIKWAKGTVNKEMSDTAKKTVEKKKQSPKPKIASKRIVKTKSVKPATKLKKTVAKTNTHAAVKRKRS